MISTAQRLIFLHVPKTGGNAIQSVLLPLSDDAKMTKEGQDGVQLPAERFDGLFKFHGIRNLWDRCVSFFFSPHRGPVDWSPDAFETFVDTTVIPSHVFLQHGPDDPDPFGNVDAVLRYEHLAADFEWICTRIGLGSLPLPRVNASQHGDYRRYYRNDDMIARIAKKFAPKIQRFGYTFDPQGVA